MKVFVAGATGVLGRSLVPRLVASGHQVVGMTRTPEKRELVEGMGATAAVADALDREAVEREVTRAAPDVIVHQLTALPESLDPRRLDRDFAATNRLRTAGTDHLLAAARAVAAKRFIAQSFAGWPYARTGGRVKIESDPLDAEPPKPFRATLGAIRHLEEAVLGADSMDGVVLRYGTFYGPGTSLSVDPPGQFAEMIRGRKLPIMGGGSGVWSFIHIEDAAAATLAAVERAPPGIYNIVDDEPAPVSEWLPAAASALGAKPPMRIPRWIGRIVAGKVATVMMTEARGASNEKAERELGTSLRYPTWRHGFREGLG